MDFPKFQIYLSKDGKFHFVLRVSTTGDIVINSPEFDSKENCLSAINTLKHYAAFDECYDRIDSFTGYSFKLKSENLQVIGEGEMYSTLIMRENIISLVKLEALIASVEDRTIF